MFGSLDPAKLLVVLVLALIILGPERLPKAARQAAQAWRDLTHLRERVTEEVRSALPDLGLDDLDLPHLPRRPGAVVSSFVRDTLVGSPDGAGDEGDEVDLEAFGDEIEYVPGEQGDATGTATGRSRARRTAARNGSAPRLLAPGDTVPERGVLVTFAPDSGDLAVTYDDPAMN